MPLWIKEAAGQPYMPSNGTEGAWPEWKFDPDGWPMCTAFVPMGDKIQARCEHTADMFGGEPQAA